MKTDLPEDVQTIFNTFTKANYQIYLVGGAVRDLLLGIPVYDWDFTTDAQPEEILKLFPKTFYDNKFGTVGVLLNDVVYEITTMRKEGPYTDFRHPEAVTWTKKIEEDLARRDFTINAMALSDSDELIDIFNGQEDLQQRIIKSVRDPDQRFTEDALRMVKAFRMVSQIEFTIEETTLQSITKNKELITEVSWERIRDEFLKLLAGSNPYLALEQMRKSKVLEVILPELERCFGVVQEGHKHDRIYDVGEHSLLTLKETPAQDPIVRFAALIHDIGKPNTYRLSKDGNVTFYNHEVVGGNIAKEIAKRFRLSKDQSEKLYRLVRWHLFTVDENQTDSAIRRFVKNVGRENIQDMYNLRIGDRLGGGTQRAVSWRMDDFFNKRIPHVLTKPFSVTDLKINGQDVMKVLKIKPGPQVGEILNKLFEEVLEDGTKNNSEYLLQRAKELI